MPWKVLPFRNLNLQPRSNSGAPSSSLGTSRPVSVRVRACSKTLPATAGLLKGCSSPHRPGLRAGSALPCLRPAQPSLGQPGAPPGRFSGRCSASGARRGCPMALPNGTGPARGGRDQERGETPLRSAPPRRQAPPRGRLTAAQVPGPSPSPPPPHRAPSRRPPLTAVPPRSPHVPKMAAGRSAPLTSRSDPRGRHSPQPAS